MTKREKIYAKYDGHCAYCGNEITIKEMQIDHIVPQFFFKNRRMRENKKLDIADMNKESNLVPACRKCNFYKSTLSIESFREQIFTLRERLEKIFIVKLALNYGILNLGNWDGKFYFEKVEF